MLMYVSVASHRVLSSDWKPKGVNVLQEATDRSMICNVTPARDSKLELLYTVSGDIDIKGKVEQSSLKYLAMLQMTPQDEGQHSAVALLEL